MLRVVFGGTGEDGLVSCVSFSLACCWVPVFSTTDAASFSASLAFSLAAATSIGTASVLAAASTAVLAASSFCFKPAISFWRDSSVAFALSSASLALFSPPCIFCIIFLKFVILLFRASTSAFDALSPLSAFWVAACASAILLLARILELADSPFSFLVFSSAALKAPIDAFWEEISLLRRVTRLFALIELASACSFLVFSEDNSSFNFSTLASAWECSSGSIWLNFDTRLCTLFFQASTSLDKLSFSATNDARSTSIPFILSVCGAVDDFND
mmetsp:Transcript_24712/g.44385  ORF Transcript_24712/g.44385 Transcript_24712/m.44385 type:complete len:273 (+) Transcript_24712:1657-2475(+)